MQRKSKYNAAVFALSLVVFLILFLQSAQAQVFEEEPSISSLDDKVKTYEQQLELITTRAYKEAYAGPLSLLMLSDYVCEPEWELGDQAIELAMRISKIAKGVAQIIKARIATSSLRFKDEAMKAKMSDYLSDIIKSADIQIDYFQAKKDRIPDMFDRYEYFRIFKISEKAEEILGIHIATGDEGANTAIYFGPFQLLAWAQSWSTNSKSGEICQDCIEATDLAKDLVVQLRKWFLLFWERDLAEIKDEDKKEFESKHGASKEPEYFPSLINLVEILSQYYRTNDKFLLENANKHRQEVMKKYYDYMCKISK